MMPEWKKQLLLQRRRARVAPVAPPTPPQPVAAEEELEYGPGIVDKLRSRFISLATLHQPAASGPLRRFSSLEDLAGPPPATRGRPPARGPPTPSFKRAKSMETLALPDILINENVVIIAADERPKPDTVKTFKRIFEPPSSRIPLRNGGILPPPASRYRAKPPVTNGVSHPVIAPLRSKGPPPDLVCPAAAQIIPPPPSPVVSPPPPQPPPSPPAPALVSVPPPVSKGWQCGPRSVVFDFRGKDVKPNVALRPPGPVSPAEDELDLGEPEDLPYPSGIVFEGENVVVGKGAILSTRNKNLKLRFDDCATSTFEYPSEASLLLQDEEPTAQPLRACPALESPTGTLGSYQPSFLGEEFRLGQRRLAVPAPPSLPPPPPEPEEEDAAMLTPASSDQTVSWSTSSSCHADLLF